MSVKYQELVEGVRDRAGTPDAQEAREVTGAVLGTLVHAVPADEHRTLLGALPAPVTDVAGLPVERDVTDLSELLDEIGRRTGRTSEQARYLLQAVLAVLDDQDPDLVGRIESHLPDAVLAAVRPGRIDSVVGEVGSSG